MNSEKLKNLYYVLFVIIAIIIVGYLFVKYVLSLLLPFLIAWAIAFAMRPVALRLHRYIRIPHRIIRLILTVISISLLLFLVSFGVYRLGAEAWNFIKSIDTDTAFDKIISDEVLGGGLLKDVFSKFSGALSEALLQLVMSLVSSLGELLSSFVSAVPKAFLFIIITIISAIYFALDLEKINARFKSLLPLSVINTMTRFKDSVLSVGLKYMASYLCLMLITFTIMLVGFSALRVRYVLLLSFTIALIDILPLIGVGTVIVPWSIYSFASGSTGFGIGLVVLFVVYTLVREFAEPKILGRNLGVHPVLTLLLLYVGYSLFGFMGLLIIPIAVCVLDILFEKKNTAHVP